MIYVLDFGSQYSHLITRRIREMGVFAELVPPNFPVSKLKEAEGIILSGGPQNLSDSDALRADKKIFSLRIPILGICYGMQLTAYELGGRVKAGKKREYGPTDIKILKPGRLLAGLKQNQRTWMSHGDQVTKLPKGFVKIAGSANCAIAAMADGTKKIYGLQFHPEVVHTKNGTKILQNFLKITHAKRSWSMKNFVQKEISKIKNRIGDDKAICALSGGVDSAVAAEIVRRAIGKNLTCIFVDTGFMREGEARQIRKAFSPPPNLPPQGGGNKNKFPSLEGRGKGRVKLKVIDAQKEFLAKLKGVTDPEKKRKIIGALFIKIFEREAKKLSPPPNLPPQLRRNVASQGGGKRQKFPPLEGEGEARLPARQGGVKYLVQGTLYTDAITSGISIGKTAAVIKSHHNVGGLPKQFGLELIEPLRDLYKYEVRKLGRKLGLPRSIYERQPFPGPGLAVRVIGEVTKDKLELLRKADAIVCEEIEKARVAADQYFAVIPDIRSVGVQGDARTYGHPIIIRALNTADYLTVHWTKIPHQILEKISARITNEVRGINRVVYDITSKPPATVEWE